MVYFHTQLLVFGGGAWGWGVKLVSCTVFHSQKFEKITILQNLTTIHGQNKFSDFLSLSGKKCFLEKKNLL